MSKSSSLLTIIATLAEFHSEAFERGCEQHGICIDWRPPRQPQFGGVVERVIGLTYWAAIRTVLRPRQIVSEQGNTLKSMTA